jgi:hypothetical protein
VALCRIESRSISRNLRAHAAGRCRELAARLVGVCRTRNPLDAGRTTTSRDVNFKCNSHLHVSVALLSPRGG